MDSDLGPENHPRDISRDSTGSFDRRKVRAESPEDESATVAEQGAQGGGESRGDSTIRRRLAAAAAQRQAEAARGSRNGDDQPTIISSQPPMELPSTTLHSPGTPLPESTGAIDGMAGVVLGHFQIQEYIGGGGMGCVYRAVDLALDRTVAVKVLSPTRENEQETIVRFINESKAAARLNHENIAQVHFAGQQDGLHFIAFEYVPGINIRSIVESEGTLSLERSISYTLQVAYALQHASEHGIVHRDVKPSNVLITPGDRVKVIDMGLARQLRPADPSDDLTATGITLGTFDYISPEQARDPRSADVRSDIYSLGCTFFYMLAGRPPFPGGTVLQKLLQHQGDEPPDVRQLRADIPEDVSRVLRKMLAKEPRHRFQSPSRLIDALIVLANEFGLSPAGPINAVWLPPRRGSATAMIRHLPWIVPTVVMLLGVFGLNMLWGPSDDLASDPPELAANSVLDNALDRPASPPSIPPDSANGGDATSSNSAPPGDATASTAAVNTAADNTTAPIVADASAAAIPAVADENAVAAAIALVDDSVRGELSPGPPLSVGLAGVDLASTGVSAPAVDAMGDVGAVPVGAPTKGPWVLDPNGQAPQAFETLAEAVRGADENDVIELQFDGAKQINPVALVGRKLTFRAGSGNTPVLRFQPGLDSASGSGETMINLIGSDIFLENISLELDVPSESLAEHWALFSLSRGAHVEFNRCVLTVRNATDSFGASHLVTCFLYIPAADDRFPASTEALTDLTNVGQRCRIQLTNSFLRGEAVVTRARGGQPLEWYADNCLLVTTESLLALEGDDQMHDEGAPSLISFKETTTIAGPTVLRFEHGPLHPNPRPTTVLAANSVFRTLDGSLVFHSEVPATQVELAKVFLQWQGDGNYYEQIDYPWVIRPLLPEADRLEWRLTDWMQRWDWGKRVTPVSGSMQWASTPDPSLPVSAHLPSFYEAYTIDPSTRERTNVGANITRLPRVIAAPAE